MKALFRCMSVSQAWRSIIPQHQRFSDASEAWRSIIPRNPTFSIAYCRRNPTVVIITRMCACSVRFYCSGLRDDDEYVETLTVSCPARLYKDRNEGPFRFGLEHDYEYRQVTQVINGLVCVYAGSGVFLYNTLNGEVIRLPDPAHPTTLQDAIIDVCAYYQHFFGFDPVNRVYKMLRTSRRRSDILTLGNNSSWRRLPKCYAPRYPDNICVNGVLYWKDLRDSLVSFDFSEEKFSCISIPPPQTPLNVDDIFIPAACNFVQFRGRLTLLPKQSDGDLILYMLDHHEEGGYVWTKHVASFLGELRVPLKVVPVGSLSTGEILLMLAKADSGSCCCCSSPLVYLHNYEDDTFKRFILERLPGSIKLGRGGCFTVSSAKPNFGSLDSLINGGRDMIK